MVISVGTTFKIFLFVPVVGVTSCDVECCVIMIEDSQVQGVGAGTVVDVDVVVCVCASLGIGAVVPGIVFTGILVV